ncbi:MAG: hypothetical protein JXL84_25330 [Deltaproteobacteria bacterium]|nr:hypothetical protein [Deltaproteobacteria bacterium]
MTSNRFHVFDRGGLLLEPLAKREHLLRLDAILPLGQVPRVNRSLKTVAGRIRVAADCGSSVVLMMGAHVLRSGVQRYIIDLMEKGCVTCLSMNGAGIIHDYEFALVGATTESVAKYIRDGRFGMWQETGRINDIVKWGAESGLGLGESVGRAIEEGNLPFKESSILAAAHRCGCLATVHVGIGYDIVHEHPNCDGAAYGETSYTDFLRFAGALEGLEGGVVMNFGSAVMGPEVYLKALAMARNRARADGRRITDFTTLVCDLIRLPSTYRREVSRDNPGYYFRPWKTMLVRTVADGGESFYVRGRHEDTIPQLWTAVVSGGKG